MGKINPLISVIIPVYNSQDYIIRCLDSICASTYEHIEIICVNDGSKDDSSKIIHEYRNSVDQRVVIIDQENKGVSVARNTGIEASHGDYITFIDSDDFVHPKYFEYLLKAIKDADISHCEMMRTNGMITIEDEEISEIKILNKDDCKVDNVYDHCCGKLFKREIIQDLCFTEGIIFGEDKLFTTIAAQRASSIALISNVLYYYYNNTESAVNKKEHNLYFSAMELLKDAKKSNSNLSIKYAYTGFLSYRYISMFRPDGKEIKKDCNKKLRECKQCAKRILPFKERILLNIFADFAIVYRLYRIFRDRTLLDWEKEQKRIKKMTI